MALAREAVHAHGAPYNSSELAALGAFLIEHALIRPDDRTANPLRTIVQVGAGGTGGILWFWRRLAPDAVIVGVDLDVKCESCARRRVHSFCPRAVCRQNASVFIEADPNDDSTVSAVAREVGLTVDLAYTGGVFGEGDGIDLLMLDQPDVERTFQNYTPLLSGQGVIGMHRIAGAVSPADAPEGFDPTGVERFWHNATVMIPQAFGIVKGERGAYGIGVIPKAAPQPALSFPV
jgi:hypothetical protein